jgi:hypothetical protein
MGIGDRLSPGIQAAHALTLALYAYRNDHGGKDPEGESSTEVFQKLIDEGYIYDGDFLYFPMIGKVPAMAGTLVAHKVRLRPENVSWDLTCCVDSETPDDIPLVFLTGYKVSYVPASSAMPLRILTTEEKWSLWMRGEKPALPISYKSGSAQSIKAAPDGTIPNFIPADFDPKGKAYRQLTPDGELGQ